MDDLLWDRGRNTWPSIAVARETFEALIDAKLSDGTFVDRTAIDAAEVYLACGCVAGSARAIAAFEGRYFSVVDEIVARARAASHRAREIKQALHVRLFVTPPNRTRPRVADYAGRGRLEGLIRVATWRELRRPAPAAKVVALREFHSDRHPEAHQSPEMHFIESAFRRQFEVALRASCEVLPARSIALMRLHHVNGLTCAEIATIYGKHRTTISRWLHTAQQELARQTGTELRRRFGIAQRTLTSLLQQLHGNLDISMKTILPPVPSDA